VKRRTFLQRSIRLGAALAATALPVVQRSAQTGLSAVRDSLGWLAVIGTRGDVLIRISPRFAVEHPAETLRLLTTGRLP
jgi:hypothetical protein